MITARQGLQAVRVRVLSVCDSTLVVDHAR
jgi:hypothetical protein